MQQFYYTESIFTAESSHFRHLIYTILEWSSRVARIEYDFRDYRAHAWPLRKDRVIRLICGVQFRDKYCYYAYQRDLIKLYYVDKLH